MTHFRKTITGMAFLLCLPFYASAQQVPPGASEPSAREKVEQSKPQSGEMPAESPTAHRKSEQDTSRASALLEEHTDTLISVQSLKDIKVLDTDSKELGTAKNIMVEPESGKLVRVEIQVGGGGVFGSGGGQQLSVPWDQLSLKQQEEKFVLVLNQDVTEKVAAKEKKQTAQPCAEQKRK